MPVTLTVDMFNVSWFMKTEKESLAREREDNVLLSLPPAILLMGSHFGAHWRRLLSFKFDSLQLFACFNRTSSWLFIACDALFQWFVRDIGVTTRSFRALFASFAVVPGACFSIDLFQKIYPDYVATAAHLNGKMKRIKGASLDFITNNWTDTRSNVERRDGCMSPIWQCSWLCHKRATRLEFVQLAFYYLGTRRGL